MESLEDPCCRVIAGLCYTEGTEGTEGTEFYKDKSPHLQSALYTLRLLEENSQCVVHGLEVCCCWSVVVGAVRASPVAVYSDFFIFIILALEAVLETSFCKPG